MVDQTTNAKTTWQTGAPVLDLPTGCVEALVDATEPRTGLAASSVFRAVPPVWLAWIETHSSHRVIGPATRVVSEGEVGDSLFVVIRGRLRVTRRRWASSGEYMLGLLTAGDVFGEMAMLAGGPRRASVTSATECEIIEVPKRVMEILAEREPALASELRRIWMHRVIGSPIDPALQERIK